VKPHTQLTFIPNRHRAGELREFRALVEDYFARVTRDDDGYPMDWDGAQAARSRINQMLARVILIVRAAGLEGSTPGAITTDPGPRLGQVDVLQRIFKIRPGDAAEQEVLDTLDMALGVYDGDRVLALVRTVNPIHYAAMALTFLVRGPRRLFAALGFRRKPAAGALAADAARVEAAMARLENVEELIDSRFADLQDRQAARASEQGRLLAVVPVPFT
jgi:hypothetical protein